MTQPIELQILAFEKIERLLAPGAPLRTDLESYIEALRRCDAEQA